MKKILTVIIMGLLSFSMFSTFTPKVRAQEEYFSIYADPESQTIFQGQSALYTITVSARTGYMAEFTLDVRGLPAETSYSFAPEVVDPGDRHREHALGQGEVGEGKGRSGRYHQAVEIAGKHDFTSTWSLLP